MLAPPRCGRRGGVSLDAESYPESGCDKAPPSRRPRRPRPFQGGNRAGLETLRPRGRLRPRRPLPRDRRRVRRVASGCRRDVQVDHRDGTAQLAGSARSEEGYLAFPRRKPRGLPVGRLGGTTGQEQDQPRRFEQCTPKHGCKGIGIAFPAGPSTRASTT